MLNGSMSELPDEAYERFKLGFEGLTTINLSLYKEKQMKRRINTLIERKGFSDYEDFFHMLQTKPEELAAFVDYITINVTEFFRTPDQWKIFEENVLSELLGRKEGKLKIWSCACSTGEEPYSLAMSLQRAAHGGEFEIIATDIDETVLKKARAGIYDSRSMETVPEEMTRFFVSKGSECAVCDEIKQHVSFQRLDLLRDEYPQNCDLIVCRNVLIYFTEEGKTKIYEQFFKSMDPGAYLFTGNTEQLIYYKAFGFKKIKNFIYRKEQPV